MVASVADRLVRSMAQHGAYVLAEHELRRLERVIFKELGAPGKPGHINPAWIGKDASRILAEIGVRPAVEPRLLVAEVPVDHSLVWTEQMMPVMPVVRVPDVDDGDRPRGARRARVPPHGLDPLDQRRPRSRAMARAMNCSIFVANGPNFSGLGEGGEGFATMSIASPSGDGMTRPRTFSRERRITVVGAMRIV